MFRKGDTKILCPNCFSAININDKTCNKCSVELTDFSSPWTKHPDCIDESCEHRSISQILFSKNSIKIVIVAALLSLTFESKIAFLVLFLLFFSIKFLFLASEISQHYKKCVHGIQGGKWNGKCQMCLKSFNQLKKNEEEYYLLRDIEIEAKRLTKSEVNQLWESRAHDIKAMTELSPYEFEKIILKLFMDLGYSVKGTPQTNDRGMDGIAYKDNNKFLIECKKYSLNNMVGRPELQKFIGAIIVEKAQGGFFVTTSKFSQPAFNYVVEYNRKNPKQIELINGNRLARMMEELYPIKKKTIDVMCRECRNIISFPINDNPSEYKYCPNGHLVQKNIYLKGNYIVNTD